MPLYEFRCTSCLDQFELRRNFTENNEADCPSCKNKAFRVFTPVPIVFKGSGFYTTDYRPKEEAKIDDHNEGEKKSASHTS